MLLAEYIQRLEVSAVWGFTFYVLYAIAGMLLGFLWRRTFARYGTLMMPLLFGSIVFGVGIFKFILDFFETLKLAQRVRSDIFWDLAWVVPMSFGSVYGFALARKPAKPIQERGIVIEQGGIVLPEAYHGGKSQVTIEKGVQR